MEELGNYWLSALNSVTENKIDIAVRNLNCLKQFSDQDSSIRYAIKQLEFVIERGRFPAINFMGTMGSGKSKVAEKFVQRSGFRFADADIFHPKANKEKMSRGLALTTEERIPFVERVQDFLASGTTENPVVTTCSGLTPAIRASMAGANVEKTLTSDCDPWKEDLQNIVLQVWVSKPKERALFELDRSAKKPEYSRLINREEHFIKVTYEDHKILDNQYDMINKYPPKSFQAIHLDVSRFLENDDYSNSDIIDYLLRFIPL